MWPTPLALVTVASLLAMFTPRCSPTVEPTVPAAGVTSASLWVEPADLTSRDLYYGQWGAEHAPDPQAVYTFLHAKEGGANPGMTVRDAAGREWSVKQPIHTDQGDEGPAEVVLSRVLGAVGYHQPAVYYVRSFTLRDTFGTRVVTGGRFRLRDKRLKDEGSWSWHRNPFVGSRPLNGLLVILLMFRASDLKESNNTLYSFRHGDLVEPWYVVRDLGAALGETGRFAPYRNNVDLFERQRFILASDGPFVRFDYGGFHQELFRDRLTAADVGWAGALLDGLTAAQWRDAFRAGGYSVPEADRFIRKLRTSINEGLRADASAPRHTEERR